MKVEFIGAACLDLPDRQIRTRRIFGAVMLGPPLHGRPAINRRILGVVALSDLQIDCRRWRRIVTRHLRLSSWRLLLIASARSEQDDSDLNEIFHGFATNIHPCQAIIVTLLANLTRAPVRVPVMPHFSAATSAAAAQSSGGPTFPTSALVNALSPP